LSGLRYGLLAEFATSEALLDAARRAREAGFRHIEAYSPFPVDGLAEAVGFTRNRIPLAALIGGILGGAGVYFLQWYSATVDYPLNIGGRPLNSWPSFIPATFELTILGASLAAVLVMLIMNGLPALRHPLFNVPQFDLASRNRFFLCLRMRDPAFDADRAHALLDALAPVFVCEVPL
jgi:hypothetical protein